MDIKKVKEFKADAIYEINQMVDLIYDQTEEIEYLKDKLVENTDTNSYMVDKITCLEGQIDDLNESPECPTEEISFDGEYDFYDK